MEKENNEYENEKFDSQQEEFEEINNDNLEELYFEEIMNIKEKMVEYVKKSGFPLCENISTLDIMNFIDSIEN